MPFACSLHSQPCGAGGRLRGVGHAVGVAVGVKLDVIVTVGDGVSVDIGVDDGRLVAFLATVVGGTGVRDGRIAVAVTVTAFVLGPIVDVDEGTAVGFSGTEVITVDAQAESIHETMTITGNRSFFTRQVYLGTAICAVISLQI